MKVPAQSTLSISTTCPFPLPQPYHSLCSWLHIAAQLVSRVWFLATPRTAALQASLFFTSSWSLLKLLSIDSMVPSNHLVLCCPVCVSHCKLLWEGGEQTPHPAMSPTCDIYLGCLHREGAQTCLLNKWMQCNFGHIYFINWSGSTIMIPLWRH